MKALEYDRYGPATLLAVRDVPPPPPPTGDQVQVRITRAALNPKDAFVRKGRFWYFSGRRFPKRVGLDGAGVVIASASPRFTAGQRVFGFLGEWRFARGTVTEEVTFRDHELSAAPDGVDDDLLAGVGLAGSTALQALRDVAHLGAGQRVLINGASGGVGTFAIQIARLLDAEVHTLSGDANRALCSSLGAHTTWSYASRDWTRAAPFDVVFDVFGNLRFAELAPLLAPRGTFVSTVPTPGRALREGLSRVVRQRERLVDVKPRPADLAQLGAWVAAGALRPLIDARFALAEAQAAFARLESKRTRGKIVIEVAP